MQSRHVDIPCNPPKEMRVTEKVIEGGKKNDCSDGQRTVDNDENGGIGLPTRIMKVIRPCSISRQRALSAFGDGLFGALARTQTFWSMLWPLLLL